MSHKFESPALKNVSVPNEIAEPTLIQDTAASNTLEDLTYLQDRKDERDIKEQERLLSEIIQESAASKLERAVDSRHELPANRPSSKQRPSLRFRMPVSLFAKAAWKTRGMEVGDLSGKENIEKIPEDRNIVVACSHISDLDMPTVAAVLSNYLNVAISDQSTHHQLDPKNPMEHIGNNILVGEENFMPIDYQTTENGKIPGRFNPENYIPMVKEMDTKGKVVIVAASNPIENFNLSQEERAKLSSKPGYAAAYLAGMADAIVLPVAVYTEDNKVRIVAGKPFEPTKVEELPEHGESGSSESRREAFDQLRKGSQEIFDEVAALLPEDLQPDKGNSSAPVPL